ncbi:biotin/lipoyl attachment domain-containing protein [Staphylococcus epidermidis]|uniref:hypothetical protein n=1 Tax=Staphylococcus epidermidis TaxID=1282 RepID=UPI0011A388D3
MQSLKTLSHFYPPISPKILQLNQQFQHTPQFLNQSPYQKPSILKIQITHHTQLQQLLSPHQYSQIIPQ